VAQARDFLLAMPTGQVLRVALRIMMQPGGEETAAVA